MTDIPALAAEETERLCAEITRLRNENSELANRIVAAAPLDPDYILPCDVHLPPATIIRKGCKLSKLLSGIKAREGAEFKADDETIKKMRAALAPPRESFDITAEAKFLLDRLQEYDPGDFDSERDFHGHIAPAIARLRTALSRPNQSPQDTEQ